MTGAWVAYSTATCTGTTLEGAYRLPHPLYDVPAPPVPGPKSTILDGWALPIRWRRNR
jgi:hypothetical protein